MPLPQNIQLRVAHLHVLIEFQAFNGSVVYWRLPADAEHRWCRVTNPAQPLLIGHMDAIEVDSDCDTEISAPDGGIIHINGDLNANMETGGLHEVVIRGNVSKAATIRASGYCYIYIGGSVFGRIESIDGSTIWVDGDWTGSLTTGSPFSNVYVAGDLSGTIAPREAGSLLNLTVEGFASHDLISSISLLGYTVFNASIGSCDCEPGLYPEVPGCRKTDSGYSHNCWCVLSRHNGAEH